MKLIVKYNLFKYAENEKKKILNPKKIKINLKDLGKLSVRKMICIFASRIKKYFPSLLKVIQSQRFRQSEKLLIETIWYSEIPHAVSNM